MARTSVNGSGFLTFYQQMATENPCYKKNVKRSKTTHLILHSTGANNPNLKRYVTPDDGYLGKNSYNNGWNNPNANTLVHGVIGKNKSGVVEFYQIAPWGMRIWGSGSGNKGNGNDIAIQVEIAEDQTLGADYAKATYDVAVRLYAHLCKSFDIKPDNIWSHNEAHDKGYASNHGDPEHWWKKHGLTMNGFRADVKKLLESNVVEPEEETAEPEKPETTEVYRVRKSWTDSKSQIGAYKVLENAKEQADKNEGYKVYNSSGKVVYTPSAAFVPYRVKITANVLNVRAGAGTSYKVTMTVTKGGVYTIVEEKDGWGKLKSGAGWISLQYTEKV